MDIGLDNKISNDLIAARINSVKLGADENDVQSRPHRKESSLDSPGSVSRSAANRLETGGEYKSPAHLIRFPREPQFVFPALSSFSVRRRCPCRAPVLLPSIG